MKILITGKNGQIGWELARSLMPVGKVIALDRTGCDLSHPETVASVVQTIRPDVIINAAAYTAVDEAENEEELATTINGTSVGVLAEQARKLNALLIHYSTDYVFDGEKAGPYTEEDMPNPINAYGRSKLVGEKLITQSGCEHLIFRTAWVYASRGNNFLKTMLRLAQEQEELHVVAEQHGAPTWARNIADVTAHVLVAAQQERQAGGFESGIYHLCASGKTSWHGFSNAIIEHAMHLFPDGIKAEKVLPISSKDYPRPAQRPNNSQLDSSSLAARFGVSIPEWREGMALCIDEALEA